MTHSATKPILTLKAILEVVEVIFKKIFYLVLFCIQETQGIEFS